MVEVSGTVSFKDISGCGDKFSLLFCVGAKGLSENIEGIEDGGSSPSGQNGNSHIHTDSIGEGTL